MAFTHALHPARTEPPPPAYSEDPPPFEEEPPPPFQDSETRHIRPTPIPNTTNTANKNNRKKNKNKNKNKSNTKGSSPSSPTLKYGLMAGLVGVIAVLWMSFTASESVMVISHTEWSSTIYREQLKDVVRSGWDVPPGARVLDAVPRESEERHSSARRVCRTTRTRQNYDPPPPPPKVYLRTETECFDDGTCIETDIYEDPTGGATVPAPPPSWVESEVCTQVRKDDPVIKTWYTFERPEWTSISPIVASGSDRSPYWPQMETSPILRESSRSQTLSVYFKDQDDGSLSVFHPPASDFGMYLPGLSLPVSRNWWGISSVTFPTDDDE